MVRVNKAQAIKLKKLGYDVPANENYFEGLDESRYAQDGEYNNYNKIDVTISAPYLDEVIDWIDTKEIFISVGVDIEYVDDAKVSDWRVLVIDKSTVNMYSFHAVEPEKYKSRTDAKSAGIDRAIKLLTQ